jgi:hypothetical protein
MNLASGQQYKPGRQRRKVPPEQKRLETLNDMIGLRLNAQHLFGPFGSKI